MDDTLEPSRNSSVLPLRQNKDLTIKSLGKSELLSQQEFDELCNTTISKVREICRDIQSGKIAIEPKREKGSGDWTKTSCTYCSYKSICLFDTSFRSCRYKPV